MTDFAVTPEFVRTANAAQLHDEARGTAEEWPASFVEQEDGSWVYRVDLDDVDSGTVRSALTSHVPAPPAPDPTAEFEAAVKAATTLDALKAALLGTKGPGAEARRPTAT